MYYNDRDDNDHRSGDDSGCFSAFATDPDARGWGIYEDSDEESLGEGGYSECSEY